MDFGSEEIERQKFPVKRKGFDRGEVTLYLHQVASAMAELEEAARRAELRILELQRDVRELYGGSENGFHQAVATSSMAGQPQANTNESEAAITADEARRRLSAASDHAARLRERAETIVEDALSTSEQIEANQVRLLASAKANRDLLLAEAHEEAGGIVSDAKADAETTRATAQRFAEELRELTAAETIELVTYAKAMAAAILETAGGQDLAFALDDDISIDLRDSEAVPETEVDEVEEADEVEWSTGLAGERPTRYEARSAKLPQIGDEAASEAIDSVESLRDR